MVALQTRITDTVHGFNDSYIKEIVSVQPLRHKLDARCLILDTRSFTSIEDRASSIEHPASCAERLQEISVSSV
ncbi:MAG: hypothetical protein AB1797_13830 [bacterium]